MEVVFIGIIFERWSMRQKNKRRINIGAAILNVVDERPTNIFQQRQADKMMRFALNKIDTLLLPVNVLKFQIIYILDTDTEPCYKQNNCIISFAGRISAIDDRKPANKKSSPKADLTEEKFTGSR